MWLRQRMLLSNPCSGLHMLWTKSHLFVTGLLLSSEPVSIFPVPHIFMHRALSLLPICSLRTPMTFFITGPADRLTSQIL